MGIPSAQHPKVPHPTALAAVQELCDISVPYRTDTDALFVRAMNETNAWHAQRAPFFARLFADADKCTLNDIDDCLRLPYVHANFFKAHEVLSIPRDDVFLHLTSSGTTGQKSQIFFDAWTITAAQRMVEYVFAINGWMQPDEPTNYLLYSYEPKPGFNVGTSFTDNYICDFARANRVVYALKNTGGGSHEFDPFGCIRALQEFAAEGLPVRILGFPAFAYFTLERMRELGVAPLALHRSSLVFFGGGWKGHRDQEIRKEDLYARLTTQLGIPDARLRDGFGSVEHCVPYIECVHHNFHVPVWSRVFIRDLRTLHPLPYGERGYLQLVSPYITSVPAQSVLMGDVASLHEARACGCDVPTPFFRLHGRAGLSRNKSCAVAAAELLRTQS